MVTATLKIHILVQSWNNLQGEWWHLKLHWADFWNITYTPIFSVPVVFLYFILLSSIFKTMHALVLKGDILLPLSVTTLLPLQGSLTHLHCILKPKTFLYLGMKPNNWQGCWKLFLGGGNNYHLEGSPSQIQSPLAARDSPVMDKVFCMFFQAFAEASWRNFKVSARNWFCIRYKPQRACKPWATANPQGTSPEGTVWATVEPKRVFSCRCNMNCPCRLFLHA